MIPEKGLEECPSASKKPRLFRVALSSSLKQGVRLVWGMSGKLFQRKGVFG